MGYFKSFKNVLLAVILQQALFKSTYGSRNFEKGNSLEIKKLAIDQLISSG